MKGKVGHVEPLKAWDPNPRRVEYDELEFTEQF
jgi:hypothetical protein